MSRTFEARYRGKCAACGDWWAEGAPIRYAGDSGDVLVHDDCEGAAAPEPKRGRVCPHCWLETSLTGECGCSS